MPRKIIIDTDPGQDDAVALLLALGSPAELDVLGIVAVAGNVGLAAERAERPARSWSCPGGPKRQVYAGCERPMRRKLVTAEHVHGKTGLDGPDLPEPKQKLEAQHGVDYIIDTLRREPEKTVTLCALGPLTNLAMAFVKAPDIVPRVAQIVLMGGGLFEGGNTTPAAEFNIYVDPEAADVVFHSRHADHQGAARREPLHAGQQGARRALPQARQHDRRRDCRRCSNSSSASTRPSMAGTAARCTTPASSPIC